MTLVDYLTLSISLLSVIVAAISLIRTRALAAEQLELERVTAELSAKQIELIEREDQQRKRPDFHVDLTKLGNDHYFLVANRGDGSAFDLNFELVDCANSPLFADSVRMFPHSELKAQSRIKVPAAIHLGSPSTYNVRLTWKERDGVDKSEDFSVYL
ncbi:MAG: hypothetical protein R3C53_28725 [Pirellulaceae bacterium]